jgi:L,D-transpeptidase catalytic domain
MRGRSCLSIRARRPERSSSIRANAISTSSSRTIWPSAMASASGASVSNGRASSGCPRNRSGRTGAPRRKWSDGSLSGPVHGGGPGNPLGARALYLGHTVFRIHGTNQPGTIVHAVSSGCFRLDNANVTDLYGRVQVGAKVLVRQSAHVSSCELGRCAIVAKNGLQPVWFPSKGWSCAWLAWAFASAPLAAATPGDRGQ